MNLTDTHCHLQFDKLSSRIEEVMAAAKANSVTRLICVGTTIEDSEKAVDYAAKYDNVWASVGNHPHDGKDFDFAKDSARLKALLARPRVVAVGEIGLDYYHDYSPREIQQKMLRAQIEVGLPSGLPFVFHVREAFEDFWRILDSYDGLRGVVHSFSSDRDDLDQALSRGLYVALNGIMTFTKDADQLAAAKAVPKNRLLLETDAPFLAPLPFRGQLCEPKHVADTAAFLAELRDEPLPGLADYTTANAIKLFGIT
jgi:TatD DNase family protein